MAQINKKRKKMNSEYNQSNKFDLNKEIEQLKNNLKSIQKKISNYEVGNNEN